MRYFKKLALFMSVIIIMNIFSFNLNIEITQAQAPRSINEISSCSQLQCDIKQVNGFLAFDFTRTLSEGDVIESVEFIKSADDKGVDEEPTDSSKKIWITKDILVHGQEYFVNAVLLRGGDRRIQLTFNLFYNDPNMTFEKEISINSGNVEVVLSNFESFGFDDDADVLVEVTKVSGVATGITKTQKASEIIAESNKVVFSDSVENLLPNSPYIVKVSSGNLTLESKFYVYESGSTKKIDNLTIAIEEAVVNSDGTVNLKVRPSGVTGISSSSTLKILDENGEKSGVYDKGIFKFESLAIRINNSYTFKFNDKAQASYGFDILNGIERFSGFFDITIHHFAGKRDIRYNLSDMAKFKNKNGEENKLNFTLAAQDFQIGQQRLSISNVNFEDRNSEGRYFLNPVQLNDPHIVIFTNGEKKFYNTFLFEGIVFDTENVKPTQATLNWEYANSFSPKNGDRVEIYICDRDKPIPSEPSYSIVHGENNVNLSTVKTTTLSGLKPGNAYDAWIFLGNQRGRIKTLKHVDTPAFKLKARPTVEDADILSNSRNESRTGWRNIKINWDFEPADIVFFPGDKVEIFLKTGFESELDNYPTSSGYENPYFSYVHSSTNDLKSVKSANIIIPLWNRTFEVDVIYTIGGKRIITSKKSSDKGHKYYNRVSFSSYSGNFDKALSITDMDEQSAVLNWQYVYKKFKPEDGVKLKLWLKEGHIGSDDEDFGQTLFEMQHSSETSILNKVNHKFTDLKPGTNYRAKLKMILQEETDFGDSYVDTWYNFTTPEFIVNKPIVTGTEGKNVNLVWNYNSNSIKFGEDDKINIYVKESSTSEYPTEPLKVLNINETNTKVELPMYNKLYNIKVEYEIKGRKSSSYVLTEANVGNIVADIKNIETDGATISWEYPEEYQLVNDDKVEIFVKPSNDENYPDTPEVSFVKGPQNLDQIKQGRISGLTTNNSYISKVAFTAGGTLVNEVELPFTVTLDLQITGLNVSDVFAETAKLRWNYSPSSQSFSDSDTVKIYLKKESDANFPSTPAHIQQNGLQNFKLHDLTELEVNTDYKAKVEYTVAGASPLPAEVSFRTIVGDFKATVIESNQTFARYEWLYPDGYSIQSGDVVKIYVKRKEDTSYGEPKLSLEHGTGEGKYDLNDVTGVDISGLTPENDYVSKVEFITGGGNGYVVATEINISTKSFAVKKFQLNSYDEYDILVEWEIEPQNMRFSDTDKVEIFVKLAKNEEYPTDPVFKIQGFDSELGSINEVFNAYVLAESLGEEHDIKLSYVVGEEKYEKEIKVTNSINPVKATVVNVMETKSAIDIIPPDNYEFVEGDKLLVYVKDEYSDGEIVDDDFLVIELEEKDGLLGVPNTVDLTYLFPETKYEVLVGYDLLDGSVEPFKLEFQTKPLDLSDLKIDSVKYDESSISWKYGENSIDFFEDDDYTWTDKLIIAYRETASTEMPEEPDELKKLQYQEYLGEDIVGINSATFKVEDVTKDYDVRLFYDLGGYYYIKDNKLSFLTLTIDNNTITDTKAKVSWKYPSNITFGNEDKVELFIKKQSDADYPSSPVASATGNLANLTFAELKDLEPSTKYMAKISITKKDVTILPIEAEFETRGKVTSEIIIEKIDYDIVGMNAEFIIPKGHDIDSSKTPSVLFEEEYEDFSIEFTESGDGFVISPTIPKKTYENVKVKLPLKGGTDLSITINEFKTEPENLAQDWLSNAYWFAFERFPDEGGYGYWYDRISDLKDLSGEYFLTNLMFAEDEFTNRNLEDRDLIAALYQIVVNREYDEEGLNFWVGIYNENLTNAQGDKKLAQQVLVDRMVHEAEFGRLCKEIGIFWTQKEQEESLNKQ